MDMNEMIIKYERNLTFVFFPNSDVLSNFKNKLCGENYKKDNFEVLFLFIGALVI